MRSVKIIQTLSPEKITENCLDLYSTHTKILVVCSTLNLDYPYGATPAIWQLLKGFYEVGCDVVVIPYRGKSIRTPWWRCYDNPTEDVAELYARSGIHAKHSEGLRKTINNGVVPKLVNRVISRKWVKLFSKILRQEKEFDGVMFIGVPLNHFESLSAYVKSEFNCPLAYYDLDVPTSLPKYGGFSFSYYKNADLARYDAIIVPSEGVSRDLMQLGAKNIFHVHFAADPDLFIPFKTKQDIDVFFYGTSDSDREKLVSMMISEPSRKTQFRFLVSGIRYNADLGNAKKISMLPFNQWRNFAGRSRINLNITREKHASTYATSTSRPFELAAMESCVISSPYSGLEKWFDIGEEIFVAKDSEEAIGLYKWLMDDEYLRRETGRKARRRVLKEHTFRHRAKEILNFLDSLDN